METQTSIFTWITLLAFVLSCQGLQLSMDRAPGKYPCGHLHCWNQVSPDGNIFSTTGVTIYDVTQPGTKLTLATISSNGAGLIVTNTKSKDISGNGTISRYSADMALDFLNETDCLYGSFECEVAFVNMEGKIDTMNATTAPENSNNGCSCSLLAYQLSKLTARFDDVEKELTGLRLNQTLLEQELVSLRQHNVILAAKLDTLYNHVSITPTLTTTTVAPTVTRVTSSPLQTTCSRGSPHTPREKILLWGNVPALCDTETDGGGWLIIQRRTKGDMDFFRGWNDYKNGFGTPDTDFWIGNDIIHNLTSQGYNELRIDMELEGRKYFATYSIFNVDNEVLNYKLTVSGYRGSAGDSFSYHSGMRFTTFDRDHDRDHGNCASFHSSAWWYDSCYHANLNGIWGKNDDGGVVWWGLNRYKSLSLTEMKIRNVITV